MYYHLIFFKEKEGRIEGKKREMDDLVQRVQVIDGPFSVHQESVLVHLDIRGTPTK